ncbi:unnamed protein product [Cuscuta campestris]|uniref:Ubiquitin-like protease family profile domain-containing protein n=1 Tax=Cuscuta campestris TaxID=132261 RepID=A0A484K6M1_9ASTE|nr:unnamed protein product [Cuscuta campestris]
MDDGGRGRRVTGGIPLDWEKLFSEREDEPPPELVVTPTPAINGRLTEMDEDQRGGDLQSLSDEALKDKIARLHRTICSSTLRNLPDGGEKLKLFHQRHLDEVERRKRERLNEHIDEWEGARHDHNYAGVAHGFKQSAPSSSAPPSQSPFASHFVNRIETGSQNAFENELYTMNPCANRGTCKEKRARRRQDRGFSSRNTPSPQLSNARLKRSISAATSHSEKDFYGGVSKKNNSSNIYCSDGPRCKNGETVVLLDEEEHEVKQMDLLDFVDEGTKDMKLYYPSRDDPDPIELCYSDMNCLAPEEYLSSTIMNFYIRYLQLTKSMSNIGGCNYHFFNTYFYSKLKEAILNKNDRESSFEKLRRWWKGINLFEKAYIFLPIHESLHWSLVIICIPDKEDESGPIVLHLDSLMLHSSKPILKNTKRFLVEEWKFSKSELHLQIPDNIWDELPDIIEEKEIEVPQQKNDYDCGPFVLFFIERFIDEVPGRLKRKDLGMFGKKWFKPQEASNLRQRLKSILAEEFKKAAKELRT